MIKGTPNGDIRLFFLLENSNDSITGVVQDITQTEISKVSKAELTDTSATVYFTAWGYDLSLIMYKKDNDHVTGSLMSTFDIEGERLKKTQ